MRLVLPCPMGEYRGSKWYRRLITGEFHIILDGGPGKERIGDATLRRVPASDPRRETYAEAIRGLFRSDRESWDCKGPFDIQRELREMRGRLFDTEELDLGCLRATTDPRDAFVDALQASAIESYLSDKERLLLVPDTDAPEGAAALLEAFRGRFGDGRPVIVGYPGSASPDVSPRDGVEPMALPDPLGLGPDDLRDALEGGSFCVVCADLRYAFAFIRSSIPIVTLLEARDWFSGVLHSVNRDSDDTITVPENTRYTEILRRIPRDRRGFRYRLWREVDGRRPFSGVAPMLKASEAIPDWLAAAQSRGIARFISGFFSRGVEGGWRRVGGPGNGAVYAAAAVMDSRRVDIEPILLDRMTSPESDPCGGPSLYSSFNYYMTENLIRWYGEVDPRPLGWDRFVLDYIYLSGPGYESLPLYRKTLLGRTRNGTLFSGAYTYAAISLLDDGGVRYRFGGAETNPDTPGDRALYLPSGGRREVGAGMRCATFIHDRLWDLREGPVPVPPFGAVVATRDGLDGLDAGRGYRWSVEWSDLPVPKEDVSWMMGGFNGLIARGVDLCATEAMAGEQLEREGWLDPLSTMTQETQLDAAVPQPRCCVGATVGGKTIALTVSGRSAVSGGATFTDLSSLAAYLARSVDPRDPIDFLTNMDGGASATLCASDGSRSHVFGYPSASDNNPAGVPRKVPSLLRFGLGGA